MSKWMIYGAYGFTGELIAREARRRGLTPILGGRDKDACQALGHELGLEVRSFSCQSADVVAENLKGVDLVLHCAGPFSATSAPMLMGCMKSKTHYLDITGEIPVFEAIHAQSERIRLAGIVAIPGVGFDVVPSDCLALMLKESLPDASELALAFQSSGKISSGTAKTMIEGLAHGGAIRRNGKIQEVRGGYETRMIDFGNGPRCAVTIPWGDVSTAYYSTGISNIKVYIKTAPTAIRVMRATGKLRKILGLRVVQSGLKRAASAFVRGPSHLDRQNAHCLLWGEVRSVSGATSVKRLKVPEAYALTVLTALASTEKVLDGKVKSGAWTPAQAFGSHFILDFL